MTMLRVFMLCTLMAGVAYAESEPNDGYPETREEIQARELGSAVAKNQETGGYTIFGKSIGKSKPQVEEVKHEENLGETMHILPVLVDQYLWQASLDEIQFMPMLVSDSAGGAISTDWYEDSKFKNERYKFNILIKKSKSVNVIAFKQVFKDGRWVDEKPNKAIANSMKKSILAKAKAKALANQDKR